MSKQTKVKLVKSEGSDYIAIYVPYTRGVSKDDHNVIMHAAIEVGKLLATFIRKQVDYGPGNISRFCEYGVLVRLSDKIERLARLLMNRKNPKNEPLEDTWVDIMGYGLIGKIINGGNWPGCGGSNAE